MNLKDLLEQIEQEKNKPEVLDKTPVVKNTVGGEAADSAAARQAFLPSAAEHYQNVESLSKMLDTTSRAGAGGTKAGVVGIRPAGGKAASNFLERFTGTGRIKKEFDPLENPIPIKEGPKREVQKPSAVLYERCMDCRKRVRKDYAAPNLVMIPPPQHINDIMRAKWAAVGLRPGEIVCYVFCVPCIRNASQEAQTLNATGIQLVQNGCVITPAQRYLKERGQRISDNVFAALKAERNNPQTDCFYGEARFR